MKYSSKLKLLGGILAFAAVALPLLASAQSVIPPNQDPGAIMNHNIQDLQRRQREPWLYRPIESSDYTQYAPEEPLIEYRNMGIQGNIILPEARQEQLPPIKITPEP